METSTPFKCFSCSTVLSSFTFTFWGECILTTTYLINHILTHIWYFPHILIYVFLVVFVMHLSLLAIVSKFDHHARASIFLGYPYGIKGYKLYDISLKYSFVSRDVIFHENIFPYSSDFLNPHSSSLDHNVLTLFIFHHLLLTLCILLHLIFYISA